MSGQVYSEPFAQIPEWILDAEISDRAVRVFGILHRYADREGHAFPGRAALAKRCRTSTASIDRALNELRDVGAITSVQRIENGAIVGNDYWLWPARPSSPVSRGSGMGDATPSRTGDATVASPVTRQEEREPTNESQLEQSLSLAVVITDRFDEFWRAYPRGNAKPAARKAWANAVRKTSADTIIDAAVRYASDPNRLDQFTPYAQKWLNQEMWNDGPCVSRTGRDPRPQAEIIAAASAKVEARRTAGMSSLFALPGGNG